MLGHNDSHRVTAGKKVLTFNVHKITVIFQLLGLNSVDTEILFDLKVIYHLDSPLRDEHGCSVCVLDSPHQLVLYYPIN
jgi:hypothetical protein